MSNILNNVPTRYDSPMKKPPQNPEFERFTEAMRHIMTVSREELQRRIEADSRKTGKRPKKKRASSSRALGAASTGQD